MCPCVGLFASIPLIKFSNFSIYCNFWIFISSRHCRLSKYSDHNKIFNVTRLLISSVCSLQKFISIIISSTDFSTCWVIEASEARRVQECTRKIDWMELDDDDDKYHFWVRWKPIARKSEGGGGGGGGKFMSDCTHLITELFTNNFPFELTHNRTVVGNIGTWFRRCAVLT